MGSTNRKIIFCSKLSIKTVKGLENIWKREEVGGQLNLTAAAGGRSHGTLAPATKLQLSRLPRNSEQYSRRPRETPVNWFSWKRGVFNAVLAKGTRNLKKRRREKNNSSLERIHSTLYWTRKKIPSWMMHYTVKNDASIYQTN